MDDNVTSKDVKVTQVFTVKVGGRQIYKLLLPSWSDFILLHFLLDLYCEDAQHGVVLILFIGY